MPEQNARELFDAIETMCRDSLESSLAEVCARDDDGEITVAMQTIIRACDALERISRQQQATLRMLSDNGIVFDGPLGRDPKNWQHVAFSIYTDLCEVDLWAQQALRGE